MWSSRLSRAGVGSLEPPNSGVPGERGNPLALGLCKGLPCQELLNTDLDSIHLETRAFAPALLKCSQDTILHSTHSTQQSQPTRGKRFF